MMKLANGIFLAALLTSAAHAQTNAGEQKSDPDLPFAITKVASFDLPWRIAFLPDGRMLVTEKVGRVDLVTPQGAKTEIGGVPPSYVRGQDGMLGVFLSPHYATDHNVYLTYVAPGDYGGGVALGRGRLVLDGKRPRLDGFQVLWRQMPTGKGGQPGGQIAFSPDGKYLFLTLGDRQRFPLPLTQEIVADALGLSIVHVNRTLQQLRRAGMIELRSGVAILLQPEQMAKLCDYRATTVTSKSAA